MVLVLRSLVIYLAPRIVIFQLNLVNLGFHLFTGSVRKHVTGVVSACELPSNPTRSLDQMP